MVINYLYDTNNQLFGLEYNNKTYLYIRDLLGNINQIVDLNGNVMVKYHYTAFGEVTIENPYPLINYTHQLSDILIENNVLLYKGYCYDVETNLFLVTSRYYNPELGRFIQPADVSSLNPSSINGLNLYSYANNNPIGIAYSNFSVGGLSSSKLVNSIRLATGMDYGNNLGDISYITFPSLYDTLGFASNLFAVINGIKVAKYLTHVHGNPPKVGWFMNNLYKVDKISRGFGYAAAIVDGINVWRDTGDVAKGIYTGLYDVGSMIISSSLGGLIGSIAGTLLGGPTGAIIGTIAGVAIEAGIQYFKENVVNWLDKSFDDFIKWISRGWGELVNA